MTTQKHLTCLITCLFISSCSNKAIYDSVQRSSLQECRLIAAKTAREECLSQHQPSFKEYEESRKKLLNK